MKCNLVPASYRQDHRRWQRPACLALGLMLAVCAGQASFFSIASNGKGLLYRLSLSRAAADTAAQ